jgi:hypothetical protein
MSMRQIGQETTRDYAQRRANETGRPYIITNFGHCFADFPANRRLALNPAIGEGIAARVFPNYSETGKP